jgi:adenosylmethionine-8-amino-7-oxononanoate aminotransferase
VTERETIVALDKRHVWHPYTAMRSYIDETDPLVIERAAGATLYDVDGRSYLDGNSSWWVAALGHGHPRLVAALREQAESLVHTSLAGVTHAPAAKLAAALAARAPQGLGRVFFSDDGSTALEVAIKMALGYHAAHGRPDRKRFVSLRGAFHGETLGVTALGGVELFRQAFAGVLMDVWFVPVPTSDDANDPAYAEVERLFAEHGPDIAGVVVEPMVQGATGMRIYPPAFLRRLREHCDAHATLLIADEVFTGFGRTGPFWAVEHAGVVPDLLATAKALSGGMFPMAATLASEAVFEAFLEPAGRALYYGHSYCGNPLGARVALEVLSIYEDERVIEGVPERAARIRATFDRLGDVPGAARPRAIGMIGAIDLADASYLGRAGWRVYEEAKKRGAYVRPLGDVVYVAPPINIALPDLDRLLAIVEESVAAALRA